MRKFHCVQLVEIKEILIIIIKRRPVFCRLFMYEHMCEKSRRKRYSYVIISLKKGGMMMSNLYDTANQLERELRQSDEFAAVKEAFEAVQQSEEAKALFEEFRDMNVKFQQKQMNGEELTEEDMDYANDLYQKASSNEAIQTLMQAEQRLNVMMQDINRILTTSLQELYQ